MKFHAHICNRLPKRDQLNRSHGYESPCILGSSKLRNDPLRPERVEGHSWALLCSLIPISIFTLSPPHKRPTAETHTAATARRLSQAVLCCASLVTIVTTTPPRPRRCKHESWRKLSNWTTKIPAKSYTTFLDKFGEQMSISGENKSENCRASVIRIYSLYSLFK